MRGTATVATMAMIDSADTASAIRHETGSTQAMRSSPEYDLWGAIAVFVGGFLR